MSATRHKSSANASVSFYDHVTLRPLNALGALHEPDFTIQLVPHHHADADRGLVSTQAPLGRAVLRQNVGDTVTIRVSDRALSMRILAVEKPSAREMESFTVGISS